MPVTFAVRTDTLAPPLTERLDSVSLAPLHKQVAEFLNTRASESFRNEESPSGEDWAELSPATFQLGFKKKYPEEPFHKTVGGERVLTAQAERYVQGKRILQEQGLKGGLRALAVASDEESARVGSNKPYARIQQLGSDGKMKGFIKSELPARPYTGTNEQDKSEIADMAARHFRKALTDD